MNIITLFYIMLYTFINISIHKVALVNLMLFYNYIINNHLKKHKKIIPTPKETNLLDCGHVAEGMETFH